MGPGLCRRSKRSEIYALRKRMGMLFQNGALLTDFDVFENVAFPLREHTDLPEPLIRTLVLTKLHAVGLRGAADLMPAELSGGMARRVALARAIVMDPEMLIYDEPFVGLDPISLGVILRLIRQMNEGLGITSIVVSHDVQELATIAHDSYLLSGGKVVASGTPQELRASDLEVVRQFMTGERRRPGAVPLSGAGSTHADLLGRGTMSAAAQDMLLDPRGVRALGAGRRCSWCACSRSAGRRWRGRGLIIHQIYNAGARSLIIIMLSGLFVGMVLGLQGFDLLQRFGSEDALGVAAALGLLKELGPVVTALLFAGRAGTSLTSEIGLMRATDQLTAMEMMAVDPMRYVAAPRFLGGVIAMPLLAAIFNVVGLFGAQLVGVQLMGVDAGAFWSQMQGSVRARRRDRRHHQERRVRLRLQPDRRLRGLQRRADRRGRGSCDHAHRRRVVGSDAAARLHSDRSVSVRGTRHARQSYSRNRHGPVRAARLRGAVLPHHAAARQRAEAWRRQDRLSRDGASSTTSAT